MERNLAGQFGHRSGKRAFENGSFACWGAGMYLQHFGLTAYPFKITPDPGFLFWTQDHQRAYDAMSLGVFQHEPITVVTGDIGVGKTTLLRRLISEITPNQTVGLVSNFSSGDGGLLPWVTSAFGLPPTSAEVQMFERFRQFVLDEFALDRRVILIIDEAQNVSDEDLEQLRILSNINSERDVRLLLFLVGQPDFRSRLKAPQNRKILQRVGVIFHFGVMTKSNTADYIEHRLRVAGARRPIFDAGALDVVAEASGGVPRKANVICEMLLFAAFRNGSRQIDVDFAMTHLEEANQTGVLSHFGEVELPLRVAAARGQTRLNRAREPVRSGQPIAPRSEKTAKTESPLLLFPKTRAVLDADEPSEKAFESVSEPITPDKEHMPVTSEPDAGQPRRRIGMILGATSAAAVVAIGLTMSSGLRNESQDLTTSTSAPEMSVVTAPVTAETTPNMPPDAAGGPLIDDALAPSGLTPRSEVIAFARAALRGEAMAAYFLGQLFESGDGLPSSPALARAWYERASAGSRGARRRLANLDRLALETGQLKPPLPLLGGLRSDGSAEFVWAAGEGSGPSRFLIETAAAPGQSISQFGPFDLSAALVATQGEPKVWRVIAVPANGEWTGPMSDWHELSATPVGLR